MGFWSKQPDSNIEIEIPHGYEIKQVGTSEIPEILNLLNYNYVTSENMRLVYPPALLNYELKNQESSRICLYKANEQTLIGFIHLKYITLSINNKIETHASINFLCIHPKYRGMNLAPLLIKYSRSISNSNSVFKAVFTGNLKLPGTIFKTQYLHRMLKQTYTKKYDSISEFCKSDSMAVYELLKNRTNLFREIYNNSEEVWDRFKTREGGIYSFVNRKESEISGFGSFFIIETHFTDYDNTENNKQKNAYLTFASDLDILKGMFYEAKVLGCDTFDIIDVSWYGKFHEELFLLPGTGHLFYSLFNSVDPGIGKADTDFVMF